MKYIRWALLVLGMTLTGGVWPDETGPGIPPAEMQPVRFAGWDRILQEHKGHITVVDLWASWCSPCIERFPHMVDLYHRYHDQGVRFISLNFDQQGDIESLQWANRFLQRIGAAFPNYHMDENMTAAFDHLDLQGLPVVLIYGVDGAEAYRLTGDDPNHQFHDQDVENAVLALLGQKPRH